MGVSVGTHEECIKSLRSFGVPTYALPFDEQRRIDTKQVVSKWQKRKEMENQNQNQEATKLIVPGPFDVLIGKSYMCREHIGNIRYRSLVANHQTQYKNLSSFDKTAMSLMIVGMVKESSGRFLKEDSGSWVEVDDKVARKKVSHCFRTMIPSDELKRRKKIPIGRKA